jgi:carbon-monoxide dehydrogenase medium subunit
MAADGGIDSFRRVKPAPFAYHRPASRDEVDALLAEHGDEAKILAGGQSLIPILNMRLAEPGHIIDLGGLEGEPRQPSLDGDTLAFAPMVRQAAAERSPLVSDGAPLVAEALAYVAHAPIRSRGTVVGSVAHADPAAELPAVLLALDGEVTVRSAGGSRAVPAAELFVAPLTTSLSPSEWIEEVRIQRVPSAYGTAVEEFSRRRGDFALCGVIAIASRTNGSPPTVGLTYYGLGGIAQRVEVAADTDAALEDAIGDLALHTLEADEDLHATAAYRRHLATTLGARAARRAIERMPCP